MLAETWFGVSRVTIVAWVVPTLLVAIVIVGGLLVAEWRGWIGAFEAEIVGKSNFHIGEQVKFKAHFKGKLERGFFTCEVIPPNKTGRIWWGSPSTFYKSGTRDIGVLSGKNHASEWDGEKIPANFPIGTYTARITVCDSLESENKHVEQKNRTFTVVPPYTQSGGTTIVVQS
jgi:hypothetical protein